MCSSDLKNFAPFEVIPGLKRAEHLERALHRRVLDATGIRNDVSALRTSALISAMEGATTMEIGIDLPWGALSEERIGKVYAAVRDSLQPEGPPARHLELVIGGQFSKLLKMKTKQSWSWVWSDSAGKYVQESTDH